MKTPSFMGIFAVLALASCAPETAGGKAAHARHEAMEELGDAFDALKEESGKAAPDSAAMTKNALAIAELAEEMPAWFSAGSGPQDGVKTHAKADVWTNEMEFADKVRSFQDQARELKIVAKDGPEAITAQINDLGRGCKACHDQFREKK